LAHITDALQPASTQSRCCVIVIAPYCFAQRLSASREKNLLVALLRQFPISPRKRRKVQVNAWALYTQHCRNNATVDIMSIVQVLELLIFVVVSLFVALLIIKVLSDTAKHSQLPIGSVQDVQRGVLIMWFALTIVWILQTLGLTSLFSSLTISGIVGLGVTLALQSTLSNILSGIWLLRDKVLRLGDRIKIGDIEGTVTKLSFRSTWLKTNEGHIVVMSNSTLYNGPFTNFTARDRLSEKIAITKED